MHRARAQAHTCGAHRARTLAIGWIGAVQTVESMEKGGATLSAKVMLDRERFDRQTSLTYEGWVRQLCAEEHTHLRCFWQSVSSRAACTSHLTPTCAADPWTASMEAVERQQQAAHALTIAWAVLPQALHPRASLTLASHRASPSPHARTTIGSTVNSREPLRSSDSSAALADSHSTAGSGSTTLRRPPPTHHHHEPHQPHLPTTCDAPLRSQADSSAIHRPPIRASTMARTGLCRRHSPGQASACPWAGTTPLL